MKTSLKQRLLAGGSWVLAGKLVTAGSTLLTTAILSRVLDLESYGLYVISLSLVTGAAMLAQLGLNTTVVRLVAEAMGTDRPDLARATVQVVYRYALIGIAAVAAFLLAGGGSWLARTVWEAPLLAGAMVLIALWVVLQSLQVLTSETFRGFHDIRLASVFGGVITGSLSVVLLGGATLYGIELSLNRVIGLVVVSGGISLAIALTVLKRKVGRLPQPAALRVNHVFGISLPLWINALCAFGLNQSDVLILGAFRPGNEVGLYGPARVLVGLVVQSMMLVTLVVPPFVAELYARGEKQRLERMLRLMATLAGVPAFLILIVYIGFGGTLLDWVFGEGFRGGATVLAILSTGRMVSVMAGSAAVTLSMTGHQTTLMKITLVCGILTVGSAILVVDRFGGTGVATAIASGVVVQNLLNWIYARRLTGMWTHVGLPRLAEIRSLFGH